MRVIQMTTDGDVRAGDKKIEKPRDPDRTRDLFGVQLEVTSLLLEGERRKLSVLQRELRGALNREAGSLKAKERQQHELILAISRIQSQYDHLEQEYRQTCIGALRSSNTRGCGKSGRSQPAIGLRQTPKARVSHIPNCIQTYSNILIVCGLLLSRLTGFLLCVVTLNEQKKYELFPIPLHQRHLLLEMALKKISLSARWRCVLFEIPPLDGTGSAFQKAVFFSFTCLK